MKLLWLSHLVPYPPKAGVLIRSFHLLRELSRHFEIDLIAFNQPMLMKTYFENQEAGLKQSSVALEEFLRSVSITKIPAERSATAKNLCALRSLISTTPYTIRWLRSEAFQHNVEQKLASNHYDIIHLDTESLIPYAPTQANCPIVLDHHNIESHMLLRRAQNEKNWLKAFYYLQEGLKLSRYEEKKLPRFNSHVVCSDEDQTRLREIDKSLQTFVAPNGVPFPDSLPDRNPDPASFRLLFVGGLSWYPNRDAIHHFLDDIWPLLSLEISDIQIDIIGKSPTQKILAAAKNDSRIKIHGYVDNIDRYYREASVYICPIRDGGGTKLKIIDALAHAVPIVANPIACEGIELSHGTSVLFAASAEDYVNQLNKLKNSPQLLKSIGDNGFLSAKNQYSASAIGNNLAAHYLSIIEQHKYRDGNLKSVKITKKKNQPQKATK